MSVPEDEVLKPKSPSIEDENQWEEFVLTDVEVRDSNGSLANLLDADESLPLTVTGMLATLEPEQRHCLLVRYYRTEPLVVTDVRRYAYGQYEDASSAIWAAGNAGWFKIQPAESYQGIYQAMLDTINIFYFIADAHREDGSKRKTRAHPTAEALFEEYAARPSSNIESARSAASLIYKHRTFLIMAMLKGKEGIDWPSTPLYSHLEGKFMADFLALRKKLEEPKDIAKASRRPPSQRARSNTNSSLGSTTRQVATDPDTEKPYACEVCGKQYGSLPGLKYHRQHSALCDPELQNSRPKTGQHERSSRRSSRASAGTPVRERRPGSIRGGENTAPLAAPDAQPSSSLNTSHKSTAAFIIEAMKSLSVWRQQRLTIRGLAALLFEEFELESEKQAADLIRAQAAYLNRLIQDIKRSDIDWKQTPLYRELVTARLPEGRLREILRVKLRRRESAARHSHVDILHESHGEGTPARRAYKGKSVLRPRTTRLPDTRDWNDSFEDDDYGDGVGHETPTKRKRNGFGRLESRKRAGSFSDKMDIDMPSPPESASQQDEVYDGVDEELEPSTCDLPLRSKLDCDCKPEPPLFAIVELPLPSYTPQGPGDTWTCTFDGCLHKIYAASDPEAKGFIEDHYEKHAAEERVNLVYKEQRPHLPVGHLIKRIRELAEQQQALALFDGTKKSTGHAFPKPIERRY